MNRTEDRRSPTAVRVSHSTLVDICSQDGDASPFQGQSTNISGRGMLVQTSFLPEIGEGLVCRFTHDETEILVEGVVAWRSESAEGGEFGIQFTALDADSAEILQCLGQPAVLDSSVPSLSPIAPETDHDAPGDENHFVEVGSRVRLHIDGLGAPMKACVHEGSTRKVRVGSSLEFLKLGRPLELEDVGQGARRGAQVDSVNVVMNPSTQVPELVVQLRYEGVSITPPPAKAEAGADDFDDEAFGAVRTNKGPESAEEEFEDDEPESWEPAAEAIRERFSQAMSQAGSVAQKAGGVLSGLARARPKSRGSSRRKSSAPEPTLRAQSPGKRRLQTSRHRAQVSPTHLRSGIHDMKMPTRGAAQSAMRSKGAEPVEGGKTKRRIPPAAMFAFAFVVFGASAYVLRGPTETSPPQVTNEEPDQKAPPKKMATAVKAAPEPEEPVDDGVVAEVPLFGPQAMAVKKAETKPSGENLAEAERRAAAASVEDQSWDESEPEQQVEQSKPWGSGRLYLPTIHRIRLDGVGAALAGAANTDGFTVVVPGRKAMETGKAIQKRDKRIVGVSTNNNARGATIKFEFRGPVPPYRVRLRQDFVEFLISAPEDSVARL